ncbi:inc metabolism membrane protein [Malassezia psittaci]|uniref:Inc metabolism membrane protein n=1 Tax=Malassezia psittaci TaxID=1821823 RepID=A0AAF0JE54_9BASI|nr:inc metabolism membrane protein [Malassezia psittaci]
MESSRGSFEEEDIQTSSMDHEVTPVTAAALAALPDSLEGGPALRASQSSRTPSFSEKSEAGSTQSLSVVDALDLQFSLPYWLAYLRSEAVRSAQDMEQRMHALMQGSDDKADGLYKRSITMMSHQLDLVYRTLGNMSRRLPMASMAMYNPIQSQHPMSHKVHALMGDWEIVARKLHPGMFPQSGPLSFDSLKWNSSMQPEANASVPAWSYSSPLAMVQSDWPTMVSMPSREAFRHEVQRRIQILSEQIHSVPMRLHTTSLPARFAALEQPASDMMRRFEQQIEIMGEHGRAGATELVQRASKAVCDVEDALYEAARELAREGRVLISYQSLPTLWRNNEFIYSGYRFIPLHNWTGLLGSIFQIHNETGNIHTHLGGLVLVVVLFWFTGSLDPLTTTTDRWIQTVYLLAAAKCLICSVSWHVMAGCSNLQWFQCFACIDYTGISWLVAASLLTLVYNGFYCQPDLIAFYSVGIFALGLTMGILPWYPWFDDPKNRALRISLFIIMALVGVVPFSHGMYLHGFMHMLSFFSPIIPSLASYIAGVAVYALRFPEKYWPGKFDLLGQSHQMWHVAIVLAIAFHYRAILLFHQNRFAYSQLDGTCPTWSGMPWRSDLFRNLLG